MAARLSGAPLPPLFFDEDDDFGEFEFVSAPPPPPPQQPPAHIDYFRMPAPLHPLASVPNVNGGSVGQSAGVGEDGDEWGDFMESPVRFDATSPVSPSPSFPQLFPEPSPARSEFNAPNGNKGWEKPTGAIPLSIFGEDEGEVEEPDLGDGSTLPSAKDLFFASVSKPTKGGLVVGSGRVGIQDLLADLYGQAQSLGQVGNGEGKKASNGAAEGGADDVTGHSDQDDDFDEGGWEFKAAVPELEFADPMVSQDKNMGDLFSTPDFSTNGDLFQNHIVFGSSGEFVVDSSNKENITDFTFMNGHASDEKNVEVGGPILGSKDSEKNIDFFDSQEPGPISDGKCQELNVLWGNHMEDLSTLNASNMKSEISEDIEPKSRTRSPRSNGVFSNKTTDFPDLLMDLYEETNRSKETEKISTKSTDGSANAVIDPINTDVKLFHDNSWYLSDAFLENRMQDNFSLHSEIHQETQTKSEKQQLFISFYSDLKQVACSVALSHLESHEEAYELAVYSGEKLKATELYQELRKASAKLDTSSEDIANVAKDINSEGASRELLETLKHPQLQALDMEFSLSERIVLAEKEMDTASDLYEHAMSTLYILKLASVDEQQRYAMAWSKMLLACLEELQHGSDVWTECVRANMCSQILSDHRGYDFLVALGEIYRVSEVLHVSLKVFKAWMLLSTTEESDPFAHFDRCAKLWVDSGLNKALESIPEQTDIRRNTKLLLESIKSIHNVSVQSLQNRVSTQIGVVCQLSLLPLAMLPDMKDVIWDGKSYFLKLANLWINRVSCDPPSLIPLRIG